MTATSFRSQIATTLAALLAGSVLVAACGRNSAADPTSSGGSAATALPLCKQAPHLERLVVRRTDANPQLHLYFPFPPVLTVDKSASVQEAAKALCALPRMPKGAFHCPADIGIDYRLRFSAAEGSYPAVLVHATGCEQVSGVGPTRWIARTPSFWHELGKAIGLASANWSTFAGAESSTPVQCRSSSVRVVASTNRHSYGPGAAVLLKSSITNTSKKPCSVWIGFWPSAIVTNYRGLEVWGRCWGHDEPGACSMVVASHRLNPGGVYAETWRWDQRSGAPGRPPTRVPPGTYRFATQYQGTAVVAARFVLSAR